MSHRTCLRIGNALLLLKSRFLRGAMAIVVASVLLVVVAPFAGAEVVGTSAVSSVTATADQNKNKDGNWNVQCGSNQYLVEAKPTHGYAGTYPDVAYVNIYCWTANFPGDDQRDRMVGLIRCEGSNVALTGLMVNADRYIKDWKYRCGEITDSGGKVSIKDLGYTDWLLDQVENNDTQTILSCGTRQVVTGLQIGYKSDASNSSTRKKNFTSVQLSCATLSATSKSTSTTTRPMPRFAPVTIGPVTTTRTPKPVAPPAATSTTTDLPATPATPHLPTTPTTNSQPKRPGAGIKNLSR